MTHTESPPRKICSATPCTGSRLKLAHRVINCKSLLQKIGISTTPTSASEEECLIVNYDFAVCSIVAQYDVQSSYWSYQVRLVIVLIKVNVVIIVKVYCTSD